MKTEGTALVAGGEAERYGERCVMMPGLVWPHMTRPRKSLQFN